MIEIKNKFQVPSGHFVSFRVIEHVADKQVAHSSPFCALCVERYGLDAKINQWSDPDTADCPRKQENNVNDPCGAIRPDLLKVV